MVRATVDRIMKMHPCIDYTRERVETLWGGKRSLTLREIAALDIPVQDRIWALTRLVPVRVLFAWACDCTTRVMPIWRAKHPKDRRPQRAISTTRKWLRGEATIAEVQEARTAASAAADAADAAADAADAAAYAAAYAADAAADAADAADAANAAADAARQSEIEWQGKRMLAYLDGEVKP